MTRYQRTASLERRLREAKARHGTSRHLLAALTAQVTRNLKFELRAARRSERARAAVTSS